MIYPSAYDLKYFLEVAAQKNISRAAERLGITQPSLTQSVKKLEHSLGNPLLIRSKSGVKLTKFGERFRAQAQSLMESWEHIVSQAKQDEHEVQGRFSLGCHPSVALYTLPHFLPQLLSQNPRLDFQLQHDLSRKITEDVVSSRVDFGLVINPTPHPDLIIRELCRDEVCFWVSPQAKQLDTLIYDPDLRQNQELLQRLEKKKIYFHRQISSSNLEVILELCSAGVGVGLLPSRVAARAQSKKPLQHYKKDWPRFEDRLCLVYRADLNKTASVRAIVLAISSMKL